MLKKKTIIFSLILMCFIASAYCLNIFQAESKTKINPQIDENANKINIPKQSAEGDVSELWNYTFPNSIIAVAISDDGNYIAAINGSSVTLFKRSSKVPIWSYNLGYPALNVDISYDGTYITVSTVNNEVFLLNNTDTMPKTEMWKYPPSGASAINTYSAISFYGGYIVSGDYNGIVRLFNYSSSSNKQFIWEYDIGSFTINAVDISYDGYYIAVAAGDGYIYVFNSTKTASKTYMFRYDTTSGVNSVKISKDGKYVVAGNNNNEIYLFNTTDFQGIPMWNFTTSTALKDIDISGDGTYVIVGENGNYIHLLNRTFSTGNKLPYWSHQYSAGFGNTESVAISADSRYVVSGYSKYSTGSNCTLILNTEKTSPKKALWANINYGTDRKASSVAISGFGNYLAIGTESGSVYKLFVLHHDVPLPQVFIPLVENGDDDEKEEEPPVVIPFGYYYLIFAIITMISLVVIVKRKII